MKRAIACCIAVLVAGALTVHTADAMIAAEQYGWYDGSGSAQGGGLSGCGGGAQLICSATVTTVCRDWDMTITSVSSAVPVAARCTDVNVTATYQYYA